MTENPIELLKMQTDLLNRLITLEESHHKQTEEMLEYQEDHQKALDKISRAANLYFWLTVIGLAGSALLFIFNMGVVLSFLRVLLVFR